MSTGARLRRARLDAGLTLDHISDTTKIPIWILHSIEVDDFSSVPGGVFIRGYLVAFARAAGADANEILTSHFGAPREVVVAVAPEERRRRYIGTPLWQVAALIALIVATAIVWRDAWKGADAQANVPSPAELTPPMRPPSPAPLTSTALPVSTQNQTTPPVVAAAVTTAVVSETFKPIVASQEPATTSASDPIVVSSEPDEPSEPSELDPPAPTEPSVLTEPSAPTQPFAPSESDASH